MTFCALSSAKGMDIKMSILELNQVSYSYEKKGNQVLSDISYSFEKGKLYAITGR